MRNFEILKWELISSAPVSGTDVLTAIADILTQATTLQSK
jgi:hypothetical protein